VCLVLTPTRPRGSTPSAQSAKGSTDEALPSCVPNNRRSTSEQRLPLNGCQRNRLPGQHTRDEPVCLPVMLLRKEVIQPHLPVRLPCYDFVPIARPTFDSSLHKGWATGFGCCQLS
jgi:hypothetical protein